MSEITAMSEVASGVGSEVALQAVGLVRRIEGAISHTLVNGIDLSVKKGEFVAITGPSG
jgi:lipoprotein-releasing system ATP-binding protein